MTDTSGAELEGLLDRQKKAFGEATAAALADIEQRASTVLGAIEAASTTSEERIGQLEASGQELLHKISIGSMADGYGRDYRSEIRTAYLLRLLVVAGVGVAIWVSATALADTTTGGMFDWRLFLARSSLSLLILGLASYIAGQAGVHRDAALRSRDRQRKLETFVPYLAPLSTEVQETLRASMAIHFFGEAGPESDSDLPSDRDAVGSIVRSAIQSAESIRGG